MTDEEYREALEKELPVPAEMEAFFSIFHPLLQIAIKQHASPSVPREVRREIDGEFIKEVATKSWSLIRPCLEMVIDERRKQR